MAGHGAKLPRLRERALAALLSSPTITAAAAGAGQGSEVDPGLRRQGRRDARPGPAGERPRGGAAAARGRAPFHERRRATAMNNLFTRLARLEARAVPEGPPCL